MNGFLKPPSTDITQLITHNVAKLVSDGHMVIFSLIMMMNHSGRALVYRFLIFLSDFHLQRKILLSAIVAPVNDAAITKRGT